MKFSLLASVSSVALGGFMATGLSGAANASLVCTAATFSCAETIDLGYQLTDFNNLPATFDKFVAPANNDHLTSVVITEAGGVRSAGSVTNTAANFQTFTFSFAETLTIAAGTNTPAVYPVTVFKQSSPKSFFVKGTTLQTYSLAKLGKATFSFSSAFSTTVSSTITGANVNQFIGPGTFSVLVSSSTFQGAAGGGGNVGSSLNTSADPVFTIKYIYSVTNNTIPAPEPASMALMGVGLAGLGAAARRRKS